MIAEMNDLIELEEDFKNKLASSEGYVTLSISNDKARRLARALHDIRYYLKIEKAHEEIEKGNGKSFTMDEFMAMREDN